MALVLEQVPEISEGQYRYAEIDTRRQEIALSRDKAFWEKLGVMATASLSTIALIAAVSAWIRTGRPKAPQ